MGLLKPTWTIFWSFFDVFDSMFHPFGGHFKNLSADDLPTPFCKRSF